MDKQRQRIQQYKDDAADASIADRDEHDVRKQEEVLGEIIQGRKYEVNKLKEFAIALEQLLVRRSRWCPGHAGSLTRAVRSQDGIEMGEEKADLKDTAEMQAAKDAVATAKECLGKEGVSLDD